MNRRELLPAIGTGAAFGILATMVGMSHGCVSSLAWAAGVSELTPEPDPLAILVADYLRGLDAFNAADANTNEESAAQAAQTYEPHYDRLCTDPPSATTLAGALGAIRLVLREEDAGGHHRGFTTNTLRAALAYFDGGER